MTRFCLSTGPEYRFSPPNSFGGSVDPTTATAAMELLFNVVPTGAVVLDAHYQMIFANKEGNDLVARWAGKRAGLKTNFRTSNSLPLEILDACEQLRTGRIGRGPSNRPHFGGRLYVKHPALNIGAVVSLQRSTRDRTFAVFCILLQDKSCKRWTAEKANRIAMLTLSERRVARLAAEGHRNQEIAKTLNRSIATIKSQLRSIFSKMEIRSRAELAAVLISV